MNPFAKEEMQPFFQVWDPLQEKIRRQYDQKDAKVKASLEKALANYYALLAHGQVNGEELSMLMPLNGIERLAFIEGQIPRKYAFIQLAALYDESRKKAARLSVTYLQS